MPAGSVAGTFALTRYAYVWRARKRFVCWLPITFGNAPLVRRNVTTTLARRVVLVRFVTRPLIVKLAPCSAVFGGELTVESFIRDLATAAVALKSVGVACAAAGATRAAPTQRAPAMRTARYIL